MVSNRVYMKALIGGILSFSTVDYPKKPAAVIFFAGCPFRCPFCQNPSLVNVDSSCKEIETKEIVEKVKYNKQMIDAVVITGGEPLQQPEALKELLKYLKREHFMTKLDTNGFFPEQLAGMIEDLDFVAIDVKAALTPEKYSKVIGKDFGKIAIEKLMSSIRIVEESGVKLELRTTVIPGLVTEEDIKDICQKLKPKIYVLQQFRPENTLDPAYSKLPYTTDEELERLARIAKKAGAREVWIRGGEIIRM